MRRVGNKIIVYRAKTPEQLEKEKKKKEALKKMQLQRQQAAQRQQSALGAIGL